MSQKREELEPSPKGELELDEKALQEAVRWMIGPRQFLPGKKSATADPVAYLRDGIRLYLSRSAPLVRRKQPRRP